jgi:glucose-6-phosphate dehydrogenase assembly protein OpcA
MSEKLAQKPNNNKADLPAEGPLTVVTTHTEGAAPDEFDLVIERGEARSVNLENIEKGLTALWQAAGKPRPGETEQPVTRACVFNLVICVDGDDQLDEATETIAQITWSYPCRAIVLELKPEEPRSEIIAYISAHCQLPTATGKKVCCEQITVVGTGAAAEGMWSVVLPLLVPDLPVILWWPGDPDLHGSLFKHLLDTVDRVIMDSRVFAAPTRTFMQLAELSRQHQTDIAFSDLSWSRLTPWRNLLAAFFDAPEYLPYLYHVDRVEIHYEAPDDVTSPNFSEALLMIGWLATQLGWKPAFSLQRKGHNATLILNRDGVPLTVVLHGHNDRVDELGGITQVNLIASHSDDNSDDPRMASFTVSLSDDYEHAMTFIEEDENPLITRNLLFPRRDRTELLLEDLEVVSRDHIFEAALELAGQFSPK